MVDEAFETYSHDDTISLQRLVNKKIKDRTDFTKEEKQKITLSLCRKGYRYEDIVRYLP